MSLFQSYDTTVHNCTPKINPYYSVNMDVICKSIGYAILVFVWNLDKSTMCFVPNHIPARNRRRSTAVNRRHVVEKCFRKMGIGCGVLTTAKIKTSLILAPTITRVPGGRVAVLGALSECQSRFALKDVLSVA